jgi:hypothetical protein
LGAFQGGEVEEGGGEHDFLFANQQFECVFNALQLGCTQG